MKILYATDGSSEALAAASFLARLPCRKDVEVHILTILDYDEPGDGAEILSESRCALGNFPGSITMSVKRASGSDAIVDVILLTALCQESDLIAVGASGHSGIARFFLGSVAEAVVRHTARPVLIARPMSGPLQTVVVGVDGSEDSEDAACFAGALLPLPDRCTFRLARIIPPVWEGFGGPLFFGGPPQPALVEAARHDQEAAERYLKSLAGELRAKGRDIQTQIQAGNPGSELVTIAESCNAGLLVVGAHGKSGFDRLVLGSVSDYVVRHAHCSVLVVKHQPVAPLPLPVKTALLAGVE